MRELLSLIIILCNYNCIRLSSYNIFLAAATTSPLKKVGKVSLHGHNFTIKKLESFAAIDPSTSKFSLSSRLGFRQILENFYCTFDNSC